VTTMSAVRVEAPAKCGTQFALRSLRNSPTAEALDDCDQLIQLVVRAVQKARTR
jgi:hypothetical protein